MVVGQINSELSRDRVVSISRVKDDAAGRDKSQKSDRPAAEKAQAEASSPEVNRQINFGNTVVSFEVDTASKEVVIRMMDRASGEMIREIPPKVMREVAKSLAETVGRLLDKTI
jgi:flagellar protein FlaG